MACALVAMAAGGDTCGVGGITAIYAIPKADVVSTTVVAGVVTAITLDTSKVFFKYAPDDENDIAIFEILQDAPRGKHAARALISVNGIGDSSVQVAKGFDSCCGLVTVVYTGSGAAFVVGLVLDDDTTAVDSTGAAKARVSLLGDTGANPSRTEIEITSSDTRMIPTTDLTASAVEALVGA